MKLHRWEDLKKAKLAPEKRAQLEASAEREVLELRLRELRELAGLTQAQLARRLKVTQGHLSQTEAREDVKLSTLRRYIEALGGEIEISAVFGNERIPLKPF